MFCGGILNDSWGGAQGWGRASEEEDGNSTLLNDSWGGGHEGGGGGSAGEQ